MKRIAVALLVAAIPSLCLAEQPLRSEQAIWSILAYNGGDYSATFAPESSDRIYLLAGSDSFLSLRKTFVYWWPITSEWKTDTDSLNVPIGGTLELSGPGGEKRDLPLEEFTYFNVRGEYEQNWKVLRGDAAKAEIERYKGLYDSYFKAVRDYQIDSQGYDDMMQKLAAKIGELRDKGVDVSALVSKMEMLPKPEAPQSPAYYVVPPSELQSAFILNLSAGRYSIRVRDAEGSILEGSDRSLIVHERKRKGGVGYEVIPSDKWTRSEESVTPSSVLYVNGTAELYLRPFFEDEFNDQGYNKTVDNGAKGNPNIYKWVRIQQVPHAAILAKGGAVVAKLSEEPFYVEQSKGSSLGYTIVPWSASGPYKDKEPNLIAFRVPIDASTKALAIRVEGPDGSPLEGSERLIRVVRGFPLSALALAAAFLPLLAMVAVLLARSRVYSKGPSGSE